MFSSKLACGHKSMSLGECLSVYLFLCLHQWVAVPPCALETVWSSRCVLNGGSD